MKKLITILTICIAAFTIIGCTPDEDKPNKNIDEMVTVILTNGNHYIIPLEKDGNGYIARYDKNKFKKVNGSPEQIAKQIYGNDKIKEARWTGK